MWSHYMREFSSAGLLCIVFSSCSSGLFVFLTQSHQKYSFHTSWGCCLFLLQHMEEIREEVLAWVRGTLPQDSWIQNIKNDTLEYL